MEDCAFEAVHIKSEHHCNVFDETIEPLIECERYNEDSFNSQEQHDEEFSVQRDSKIITISNIGIEGNKEDSKYDMKESQYKVEWETNETSSPLIENVPIKYEDNKICFEECYTNTTECKTEPIKTENYSDTFYADIKTVIDSGLGKLDIKYETILEDEITDTKIALPGVSHKESLSSCKEVIRNDLTKEKSFFECKFCPTSFVDNDHFAQHQLIHGGDNLLQCKVQNSSATKITQKKSFKCKICSKSFSRKTNLNVHKIIHTGKKPLQCSFCSKSFCFKGNLKVHEKIHTEGKAFQCSFCSKYFSRNSVLKIHETFHTRIQEFQCQICFKSFGHKSQLKSHERIHAEKKPFECRLCSKSFDRRRNLIAHENTHKGEKPFQCKICLKSFIGNGNLTAHLRIHNEREKPFDCQICSKSFYRNSELKAHQMIHSGERLFQCKVCSKSFNQRSILKDHENIHREEKPLNCQICLKSFNHRSNLKVHQMVHTGENSYKSRSKQGAETVQNLSKQVET